MFHYIAYGFSISGVLAIILSFYVSYKGTLKYKTAYIIIVSGFILANIFGIWRHLIFLSYLVSALSFICVTYYFIYIFRNRALKLITDSSTIIMFLILSLFFLISGVKAILILSIVICFISKIPAFIFVVEHSKKYKWTYIAILGIAMGENLIYIIGHLITTLSDSFIYLVRDIVSVLMAGVAWILAYQFYRIQRKEYE
jgi:hypothetical protein